MGGSLPDESKKEAKGGQASSINKEENRNDAPKARERGADDEARTFGKRRPSGVQDGIGMHGNVGVLRTG
jgi:hypothetical protein